MFGRLVFKSLRASVMDLVLGFLILAVVALCLPQPVSAAAAPYFDILSVKADESVTIRAYNFPKDVLFTVRMDVAGNMAIDGIVVSETKSGGGGSFEATYRIPGELRGKKTIAIRLESDRGYYAFNWFNNKDKAATSGGTSGGGSQPTSGKPYLNVLAVKQNDSVTVEAFNLPSNTNFRVRVGPFSTFSRDYVQVTTINSGSGGTLKFTVQLPDVVKNVETVTIRIDGGGRYAYNAFKNVDNGTVTPTQTPSSTLKCQVVSVSPSSNLSKGVDFDAVWTVKNTSSKTWELSTLDYKYVSGTKMHAKADAFDFTQVVKPGETAKIIVDMVAPKDAGTYTANWALVQGGTTLCNLGLTVRVR